MTRLDAFVAILDVLKQLSDEEAAKLVSILSTLKGPSLQFILYGDPGPPTEPEEENW